MRAANSRMGVRRIIAGVAVLAAATAVALPVVSAPQAASAAPPVPETALLDGGFEGQAVAQNLPDDCDYLPAATCRPGQGAGWTNQWGSWAATSWTAMTGGSWSGGSIARTEDFAAGWKWAKSGDVFGIIQNRQTVSQTFTATVSGTGTLSWFDANRASWREHDWFGFPNDYSVTITDEFNNTQTIGNYSSQVAGGNAYSTPPGCWDAPTNNYCWWTTQGKSTWFPKSGTGFTILAGRTYTLNFNSLAPTPCPAGAVAPGTDPSVCDRSTFLDDISLAVTNQAPVASPASASTPEDLPVAISPTVTDPDGDPTTVSVVSGPSNGSVVVSGPGTFTYTPGANFTGTDSFTYKANDGFIDSNTATITVTVTPVVAELPKLVLATASPPRVKNPGVLGGGEPVTVTRSYTITRSGTAAALNRLSTVKWRTQPSPKNPAKGCATVPATNTVAPACNFVTVAPTTVTFMPGETVKTITVTVIGAPSIQVPVPGLNYQTVLSDAYKALISKGVHTMRITRN